MRTGTMDGLQFAIRVGSVGRSFLLFGTYKGTKRYKSACTLQGVKRWNRPAKQSAEESVSLYTCLIFTGRSWHRENTISCVDTLLLFLLWIGAQPPCIP